MVAVAAGRRLGGSPGTTRLTTSRRIPPFTGVVALTRPSGSGRCELHSAGY